MEMLKPPLFRCNQTVTVYRKKKGSNSHYRSVTYENTGTAVNHAVVTLRSQLQATEGGNKVVASGIVKFIQDRATPFLTFSKEDIGAKIEYNGVAYTIQTINEDRDPHSNELYQYKLLIL